MLAVHSLFGAKQVVDAFDHQLASCKRHAGFGSYYIKKKQPAHKHMRI